MKGEELLNALGDIEDRYIEEAVLHEAAQTDNGAPGGETEPSRKVETFGSFSGKYGKRGRRTRLIWIASAAAAGAACFLSVMTLRLIGVKSAQDGNTKDTQVIMEEAAEMPAQMPDAEEDAAAGNAAAFNAAGQAAEDTDMAGEEAVLFAAPEDDRDFITCTTLEDAEKLAGFDLEVPEEYEGHTLTTIRCVAGEMLELVYRDSGGRESIRIRKASTEEMLDDYEGDYEVDETSSAGDLQVRIRGTFEGIDVVTWQKEGFSFSIDTDGTALSKEQASALVSKIL